MLVTSLFNRVQPLIRYEVSDMLMASDMECPCGRPFPLIAGVQGRSEEVLTLPGPGGSAVRLHPNVFHGALEMAPVGGWQVVQSGPHLTLMLEGAVDEAVSARLLERLGVALRQAGADGVALEAQWVGRIPRGRTGKAPLIRIAAPLDRTGQALP